MPNEGEEGWWSRWVVLQAHAWWCLNHTGEVSPLQFAGQPFREVPILRLWEDADGFCFRGQPTTLTVFELDDETHETFVVREAAWNQARNHEQIERRPDPAWQAAIPQQPSITVRDAVVPAEEFWSLLWDARGFSVPVVWLDERLRITTDVGAVGFEFFSRDQPPAVLRLQWSNAPPPDWQPVVEWYTRLRDFLMRCLADAKTAS